MKILIDLYASGKSMAFLKAGYNMAAKGTLDVF
jgi:hypothetical protein